MAHGPVNRAWYVALTTNLKFKIGEGDYTTLKTAYPNNEIGVHVHTRTDRTIYLYPAKEELESQGYEHKEGRIWGKDERSELEFSE